MSLDINAETLIFTSEFDESFSAFRGRETNGVRNVKFEYLRRNICDMRIFERGIQNIDDVSKAVSTYHLACQKGGRYYTRVSFPGISLLLSRRISDACKSRYIGKSFSSDSALEQCTESVEKSQG